MDEKKYDADTGDKDLEQELEDLRDMFQQELDAAAQTAQIGELIQELEGTEENPDEGEEEADALMCECCEENPRSREHGENYPYCDSCRESMKRYPLRFSGFLMILIMIVVFVTGAYFSMDYIDYMEPLADSASLMKEGKLVSGMQGYYSYISSTDPNKFSRRAVNDLLDGFISTGYFSDASSLINSIYDEDDLKKPWNRKYAEIAKTAQVLTDTYYAVMDVCEDVLSGKDYDYDEVMASLEALKSVNPKEEGKSEVADKYNEVFIEYYKLVTMSVSEKSIDEQLKQLEVVADCDKSEEMTWMYLSNYCATAAKAGDEELTNKLFKKAVSINKEDTDAYMALASLYRFAETPDPDKILAICEEAKENSFSGDTEYQIYTAIGYMLKGEGALALETMQAHMASNSYTVQKCNLYALCALYNGNRDIYKEMKEVLEQSGYEISDIVEQYKEGKLTIIEALQDKGGKI